MKNIFYIYKLLYINFIHNFFFFVKKFNKFWLFTTKKIINFFYYNTWLKLKLLISLKLNMNWQDLIKKFKNFIRYVGGNINVFWHKNIKHSFYLIFRYYVSLLFIVCILLLFFKIFPDIILCEKKTDQPPAYSGIFSVTNLNDFYVTKQSAEDNLKKMCFCEGIGAVFALLSDIEWIQLNKIINLRPIYR